MFNFTKSRTRSNRPSSLGGMDFVDPVKKSGLVRKIIFATSLVALCITIIKFSPSLSSPSPFSSHEAGITHVLVTGGAGYIGSHAALRLLKDSHRVTIVDNLSRGNLGAIKVLQNLFPEPGRLQFIYADLGDPKAVNKIFSENAFDAVMHFAAVAYVGESTLDPLKYYHNITSNTLLVLEAMAAHNVNTLIYSSTCATYGEPDKMPITEETPQHPINPYGTAKKMAEDIILDFHKNSDMAVMILRYFNVIGSDPEGRLGEAPRPELREHGRISAACFDAARGITDGLKVRGTDYKTADGTCIRDYIDVTDLVDAHVKALAKAQPGEVGIYNVGTGHGRSVKEFVEACKRATGVSVKVEYLPRRPGDYAEVFSDPSKILRELNWTAKYTDLEKSLRVAWSLARKKIDIQEAIKNPPCIQKTLRIYVFNTFANQVRKIPMKPNDEPPTWTMKIIGRILEEGMDPDQVGMMQQSNPMYPKFSSFFKRVTISLDQRMYPDNHMILWDSSRTPTPHEGFEVKRKGDKEFTANIRLEMNYMPEKYKLSLALMEVLGIEVDTRSRIIAAIWHYVKARKLQNADDPSYFNCDPALRKVFGEDKMKFTMVSQKISHHLSPPQPIHLEHRIKLSGNSPAGNACYDVLVDVPFPVQRELNALLATTEKTKEIEACDEAICTSIRKINEHRKRRAFFLGFSQSPVEFIDALIESQGRDLKLVAGEASRNAEKEHRAEFYNQPWVEDAVIRYLNHKPATVVHGST